MIKKYYGNDSVVKAILQDKAETLGDKPFMKFRDMTVSYRFVNDTATRVANGLLNLGMKQGDHILIMLPNGFEILYSWFGSAKIGVVEVPVNFNLKGNPLLHIINDSRAKVMIIDHQYLDRLESIKDNTTELQTVVVLGEDSEHAALSKKFNVLNFDALLESDNQIPDVLVKAGDPATIMYTSGTTGAPKGVVQPQAFAYNYVKLSLYPVSDNPEDIFLMENTIHYSYLPLYHTAAKYVDVLGTMLANGTFVLADGFHPSTFWEECTKNGATTAYVLFTAAFLMMMPPQSTDADNSVKRVMCLPLIPEIGEFSKRFGVDVWTCYGLSEGSAPFIGRVPEKLKDTALMGKAVRDDIDIRLADQEGYEVPSGQIGEVLQRPKTPYSCMLGYFNQPDKTVEIWQDLWMHTGDLAYRDNDGFYYFAGRAKERIRRRGENISPESIEKEVNTHAAIAESAVIPVPSDFGMAGENEIMAVVVLAQGEKLEPADLIVYLESRLPRFMIPRYIKFVTDLPRTATAKVKRVLLQENWSEGEVWDLNLNKADVKK